MRPSATRHRQLFTLLAPMVLVSMLAGSASASQIGFVYALLQVNGGTNQIYGFRLDPSTGAFTPLPGFPVASGGTGTANLVSEQLAYVDGRLYVLNDGNDTMTAFSVNRSTGALTAMPFGPVALGSGSWACVAAHSSGSPVVIGNAFGGISSFVVTDITATAAPGSPFATGTAFPFSCRFSEDGNYFYTGGGLGGAIAGFALDAGTGVLAALAGSPFDSGGNNPLAYATDSSGRLFSSSAFTGMLIGPRVRAYTSAMGVLAGVSGNPFPSELSRGVHGGLHPGGFYMVADRLGNQVGSFRISGTGAETTLNAVSGSPFAAGGLGTIALSVTPDGAHVVAANSGSRNLTLFEVDASTGVLTSVAVQAANTLGASGIVTGLAFAAGEAGFVYALQMVNGGPNRIHGFQINPSSGALTQLSGFPIDSGGTGAVFNITEQIAYRNGRLYVVNDGGDTLSAFRVNRSTGALSVLPFSPLPLGDGLWSCVAVHPSGSPVVVGKQDGGLASFKVNATGVTAAAGSPFTMGIAHPNSCAFSQDGRYVYAGGSGSSSAFAGFSVDADTGVLTPLAGSPFDSGAAFQSGYATDSSGRLFLLAGGNSPAIRAFTTSGGVPTGATGNPFASGLLTAIHGLRHPSGYYMIGDLSGARVGVYRIGGSGAATTLTAVNGSPFPSVGFAAFGLALTEDGTFLVGANGPGRRLRVFRVNPATGALAFLGAHPSDPLGATGSVNGLVFAPVVPPFIDDPLTAVTPVIKAVHITELRTRIDALRAQYRLGPYAYTDPTLAIAATVVRAVHIDDLRTALANVYTAIGMPQPTYSDPTLTAGTSIVKAAHISELRAAVLTIE